MSRFILHTKAKRTLRLRYLLMGLACLMTVGIAGYTVHCIGTARAKSRETVLIYTEEEFAQYLIDTESEEYNLNGRYQLENDLDLSWLETSIGTNLEPFTGKMSGNGHVLSGLERPLFGVLKKAEVEDLFLSHTSIVSPFTYSDGEMYVDGYGALAAYAVDSTIRNCGMEGRIDTASPSEAEYLLAKASPSDADEWSGPGAEGPGITEEIPEEGSQTAGGNEAGGGAAGPGVGTGTEPEKGPGIGESGAESSPESSPEESGPGMESDSETGTAETEETIEAGPGTDGTSSTDNSDNTNNPDNTNNTENTPGGSEESTDSKPPESDNPSGHPDVHPSDGESEAGKDDSTKEGSEEGSTSGTDKEHEAPPAGESNVDSSTGDNQEGANVSFGGHSEDDGSTIGALSETIGYRSNERQHLMMKVSPVMDSGMEELLLASPSDATPSDAEGPKEDSSDGKTNEEQVENPDEEELEYIGNPDGDIYILVTAERVTVGGLIAQTEGETLISDSFALVTIGSRLEETDTYAGGIAGIIGEAGRVENSYASGLADCDDVTGGFAAVNKGYIENCYSTVTVGEAGTSRGAFTACGDGSLSGCIYDRQMACAGGNDMELVSEEEPEDAFGEGFGLRTLNTVHMTGIENDVPGNWRKTENAYPQLEYFALHEHETVAAASRASVIALMLPEELTLSDVVKQGELVLPSEIDGEEIIWETEVDGSPSIEANEIPVVGSALEPVLESTPESVTADTAAPQEQLETGTPNSEPEESETKESSETKETSASGSSLQLKASVGNVSRNFSITAAAEAAAATSYADWEKVGEAVENGAISGIAPPVLNGDGYYEIGNAEQLAWFMYKVNSGEVTLNALVTADIDMIGSEYGGSPDTPLTWVPIGSQDSHSIYEGTFDGGGHTIDYLHRVVETEEGIGFIGHSRNLVVRRVCIGKNSFMKGRFVIGGVVGEIYTGTNVISECVNGGKIQATEEHAGGIVGAVSQVGTLQMKNCANWGTISSPKNSGGLLSWYSSASTSSHTTENCYSIASGAIYFLGGGGKTSTSVNNYYVTGGTAISGGIRTATKLTDEQMRTWAFAYALNGQSMDGVWQYNEGGYPTPFGADDLVNPASWDTVGQGVIDGLVKNDLPEGDGTTSAPLQISSAEQMGVLAARVNAGETSLCADLLMDINLTGERYKGSIDNPIRWKPIGTATNVYKGWFNGKGNAIGYMKVEEDGYAGLFGCAGNGEIGEYTQIEGLGLYPSCSVTATGTSGGEGAGGFVGMAVKGSSSSRPVSIYDCYNRGSVAGMTGKTGAFIGNCTATEGSGYWIQRGYAAGSITSKTGTPGAIAGTGGPSAASAYVDTCYWNKDIAPGLEEVGNGVYSSIRCSGKTTVQMSTALADKDGELVWLLNRYASPVDGRVWQRSDLRNDGYPVFASGDVAAVTWADVGGKVAAPRCKDLTSPGTAGQASNPYQILTAEELAWFACQVNNGNPGLCAELKADINLFGGLYSGFAYDTGDPDIINKALRWIPIGSDADGKRYTGTFNGNGHTITAMRAKNAGNQGLFGTLGDNAVIKKTGITDSRIGETGYHAGGIAGYVNGTGVVVTECGNEGNLSITGIGVGGCVGSMSGTAELILDGCYNVGDISASGGVTGGFAGGILGMAEVSSTAACHATIRNCMNRGKVEGDGVIAIAGIIGSAASGEAAITGCYNAGAVSTTLAGGYVGSIIISETGMTSSDVTDCLIDEKYNYGSSWNNPVVKSTAFGTWGAAWRLNGGSFKQSTGLSWTYEKDSPYPVLSATGLPPAESWEPVGEALEYGLLKDKIKPSGNGNAAPYQIRTAEQLAWFAYQVNVAKQSTIKAYLVNDIDMKAAEGSYISGGRLNWMPVGTDLNTIYRGTFGSRNLSNPSDTHKIYQIRNLYVSRAGNMAGLFGIVRNAGSSRIGLVNAEVSGGSAGGIAGAVLSDASVAQCYNRSENAESSGGSSGSVTVASGPVGGIVGQAGDGVTIRDCYNMETVIKGTGASSIAGGIVGVRRTGVLENCYNACGVSGSITAASGTAGAINGSPGSGMGQCYSDTGWNGDSTVMADSQYIMRLHSTGNTALKAQTAGLNYQRKKEDRVWFTSLSSEPTKGWPTLVPPVEMLSLGTVVPREDSGGAEGVLLSLGTGVTIPAAKVRYASEETTGTETVSLAEWKTEYYTGWGTTSANGKIGLSGAGGTSAILKPDQMSLENPVQGFGTISGLKVYTGAACTYPTDRDILVELSSGNDRYEIRFTIKGVTSKSLAVDLPAGAAMEDELMPDGTEKTAYSADTTIKNSQYYPMEGKILKAVPISRTDRTGYQALKPIAETANYGNGQIYNAGVKLGITNPKTGTGVISGNLYYNPDTPDTNPWMKYQLKAAGGTLPYRYLVKYKADPYYDSEHPNFGYTISYQFGVMADDYSAAAGAVAGQ